VIDMRKTLRLEKQTIRRLTNVELAQPRGARDDDWDNGTTSHYAVCPTYYSYCTGDSDWCTHARRC
jgi:hypothetical protein